MAVIEKKIRSEFFDAVESGKKKYELRLGDLGAKEGDTLLLKEWDPRSQQYTGRSVSKTITYVRTFKIDELWWPKEEVLDKGLVILSLE
jgi:hypothetical protein